MIIATTAQRNYATQTIHIQSGVNGTQETPNNSKIYALTQLRRRRIPRPGATTAKEATHLIETGFQYVTTIEGVQLFRKRK